MRRPQGGQRSTLLVQLEEAGENEDSARGGLPRRFRSSRTDGGVNQADTG